MRVRNDRDIDDLAALPLFAGCGGRELRRIRRLGEPVSVRPGDLLMLERYRGAQAHIVIDGTATVSRDGRPVATVGPGSVVGARGLLDGADRNATVVAATRMRLLTFEDAAFDQLLRNHPSIAARIREQAAAHVPAATD